MAIDSQRLACLPLPISTFQTTQSSGIANAKVVAPGRRKCLGVDGENEASALDCPNCLKSGVHDSFFCSQDCLKKNWVGYSSHLYPVQYVTA